MAQFPPGFRPFAPPPPRFSFPPPPSRSNDSRGSVIAGIVIAVVVSVLLCSLCKCRNNRARAAAAAPAAGPLPVTESSSGPIDELPLRPSPAASPTPGLPAFAFTKSTKRNVTGPGEEAVTCSVCLGALQLGETVRLLPVCLHLYHAECIDPWLVSHSTCPICRSETDPTTGVGRLPHV